MNDVRVTIGGETYRAHLEEAAAPFTCAAVRRLLPLRGILLQARWSGQAAWMPLDGVRVDIGSENALHCPAPGQVLFYPEGASDTEILLPYGVTAFAARYGPLWGNHFLTLDASAEELGALGRTVWWKGAQEIVFELATNHESAP